MTKEEILKKYERDIEHWADEEYVYWDILRAMDEYGRQCFEAASKLKVESFLPDGEERITKMYHTYDDYLKELEKYNLSK